MLYTLTGARREDFDGFGQPRATALFGPTFRGEPPIRCGDVLRDPRYGQMLPHHGMPAGHVPVRSYLAVPVISRSGEVIGGLFFGHPSPDVFSERAERLVVGIAAQAAVAIDNARLFETVQQAAEERKGLLESERFARGEAERASAMKDEFLATLSHELRTPLSAILGWSHILRARAMSEAEVNQGLEVIERNARMQTQLIEDLLDMSRIISGKMRLDIQPVQPVSFVEAAIETVQPSAEAKGISLTKRLDPDAGPVNGDPGPPAAGGVEPPLERHQVYRQRWTGRGRARARELPDRDRRDGLGYRHQARVSAARVRTIPSRRRFGHSPRQGARAGPLDRPAPRGAARWHGAGHESGRRAGGDLPDPPPTDRGAQGRRSARSAAPEGAEIRRDGVQETRPVGHHGAGRRRSGGRA